MTTPHEFKEIAIRDTETRHDKTYPPLLIATNKFVYEVIDALTGKSDQEAADWILNKMDRYAAYHAEPMLTVDGQGPLCSYCGAVWPLCGHHHLSNATKEQQA